MRFGRFQPGVGWFFLGLLLTVGIVRAGPDDLLWIDASDPASLVVLSGTDAAPVRILDGYALAWAPRELLPTVRELGLDARSLGPRTSDREYAVVYSQGRLPEEAIEPLSSVGRVLWEGTNTSILEYVPEDAGRLTAQYEIVPIVDRPIRFAPRRIPSPATAVRYDTNVARYVAEVDRANLELISRRLENYEDRRSHRVGCHLAGDYLAELFIRYGLPDVTFFDYRPDFFCDNVVAVQPGIVSPDEIYVIGGHHDAEANCCGAPGADDNASGTAAVMEAARILSQEKFEATIIYIAFGGEEQGLIGSEAWASWARAEGLDIRGMINLDMIGYLPPGYTGDLDVIPDHQSLDLLNLGFTVGHLYLPDYLLLQSRFSSGNSDQQSFWDNGFPAIALTEDTIYPNPYYHTPMDRVGPSLNNFGFMQKNVQVAVALLATLARPMRVLIDHTPVADPASEATGYPVTARIRSHAPLWTDSLSVRFRVEGGPFSELRMVAVDDSGSFAATIPRQLPGRLVEYAIYARDVEGRTAREPYDAPEGLYGFIVGRRIAFVDDFEDDLGWEVGGDAAAGGWVRVRPVGTGAQPGEDSDLDAGNHCFVTANGPPEDEIGAHDIDEGQTILTSPAIDLSGASRADLSYVRWFVDETYPDDSLRVRISNDDGASWTLLETVGGAGRAWKEVRFEGIDAHVALSDRMRLQFIAEDVGVPSLVEAGIDRIQIKAVFPGSSFTPDRSSITAAYPVPFRDRISVQYYLPDQTGLRFCVYDVRGRLVREIAGILQEAGIHEVVWDGRDDRGESAPSGIYFLRLDPDEGPENAVQVPRIR